MFVRAGAYTQSRCWRRGSSPFFRMKLVAWDGWSTGRWMMAWRGKLGSREPELSSEGRRSLPSRRGRITVFLRADPASLRSKGQIHAQTRTRCGRPSPYPGEP